MDPQDQIDAEKAYKLFHTVGNLLDGYKRRQIISVLSMLLFDVFKDLEVTEEEFTQAMTPAYKKYLETNGE